jgi:hypothetical protein
VAAIYPHKPSDSGGTIEEDLLQALRDELAEERSRKESLERRGLTISAAAATSTALLLGLGSGYTGIGRDWFFVVLGIGGLAFLVSAALGWGVSQVQAYREVDLKEYQKVVDDGWPEGTEEFRLFLANGIIDTIQHARKKNDRKADRFQRATWSLLFGAGAVVVTLGFVVVDQLSSA